LTPTAPIRKLNTFTFAGAWYDGWETRRHNTEPASDPADWVIIRLGVASGKVRGIEIDTAFFNGNNAPAVSVEGVYLDEGKDVKEAVWTPILPKMECGPSARFGFLLPALTEKAFTHVRLHMYPDGGIARFRLYGTALPLFAAVGSASATEAIDLAALTNGALAVSCSDQHFGKASNLLLPGRGVDMGDGWETKRSRGQGHTDWVIVKLGAVGAIEKVVVDTAHFRGNFPREVAVEALSWEGEGIPEGDDKNWVRIVEPSRCKADLEHTFEGQDLKGVEGKWFTHAKIVIIPDGGVKRFRVFGRRKL
jgi:allantoicase